MNFVGATALWPARRARAATQGLRPQRRAQNSLGSFEHFLFGSRRNRRCLCRVEDRYPILANQGQHEFDTRTRIQVHRPYV